MRNFCRKKRQIGGFELQALEPSPRGSTPNNSALRVGAERHLGPEALFQPELQGLEGGTKQGPNVGVVGFWRFFLTSSQNSHNPKIIMGYWGYWGCGFMKALNINRWG